MQTSSPKNLIYFAPTFAGLSSLGFSGVRRHLCPVAMRTWMQGLGKPALVTSASELSLADSSETGTTEVV